jgi:hypothetical protein
MKILTKRSKEWRPCPFPCATVFLKTTWYFLGIPVKSSKKKIK